jgi:hypothetical protein
MKIIQGDPEQKYHSHWMLAAVSRRINTEMTQLV